MTDFLGIRSRGWYLPKRSRLSARYPTSDSAHPFQLCRLYSESRRAGEKVECLFHITASMGALIEASKQLSDQQFDNEFSDQPNAWLQSESSRGWITTKLPASDEPTNDAAASNDLGV
jgi:hypothetical protein